MDSKTYDQIFGKPSELEVELISKIARRFQDKLDELGEPLGIRTHLEMDITAAHHSCPLKLQQLLDADDFNFIHDVGGIRSYINRETGKLEHCFLPRFAKSIKDMTNTELERITEDDENDCYEEALHELESRCIDDDRVRQMQGEPTLDPSGMQPS